MIRPHGRLPWMPWREANYWMPSRTTMTSNERQIHSKCVPRAGTPNRQINHCQINEFTAVDWSDKNGIVEPSFEVRFHQFDNLLKQLFCEMVVQIYAISWLLVRILCSVALINFVLRFNFKMTIHLQNIIKLNLIDFSFLSSTCVCSNDDC